MPSEAGPELPPVCAVKFVPFQYLCADEVSCIAVQVICGFLCTLPGEHVFVGAFHVGQFAQTSGAHSVRPYPWKTLIPKSAKHSHISGRRAAPPTTILVRFPPNLSKRDLYIGTSDDLVDLTMFNPIEIVEDIDVPQSIIEGIHENCLIEKIPFKFHKSGRKFELEEKIISIPHEHFSQEMNLFDFNGEKIVLF